MNNPITPSSELFKPPAAAAEVVHILRAQDDDRWRLGELFAALAHDCGKVWLGIFADEHQVSKRDVREAIALQQFFTKGKNPELSYAFHREVFWAVHDNVHPYEDACGFLTSAVEKAWSLSQFREYLRSMAADEEKEMGMENNASYSVIGDFRRFVTREYDNLQFWAPERAKLVLDDLGPKCAPFLRKLTLLAAKAIPPGK